MKKFSFRVEPFAPAGLFLLFFSWEPAARAAVIASVLAHELSHLAAAKLCSIRKSNIFTAKSYLHPYFSFQSL